MKLVCERQAVKVKRRGLVGAGAGSTRTEHFSRAGEAADVLNAEKSQPRIPLVWGGAAVDEAWRGEEQRRVRIQAGVILA